MLLLIIRFFENCGCELTLMFCGNWISKLQLEIHDASISGWIDLCCSALYNISIEEYNTRLAVQMLHSHILHVLATIRQQAALGKYISSFKPQWVYCMYKLQLLGQEAFPDIHACLQVVGGPWWDSLCKTRPAA